MNYATFAIALCFVLSTTTVRAAPQEPMLQLVQSTPYYGLYLFDEGPAGPKTPADPCEQVYRPLGSLELMGDAEVTQATCTPNRQGGAVFRYTISGCNRIVTYDGYGLERRSCLKLPLVGNGGTGQ